MLADVMTKQSVTVLQPTRACELYDNIRALGALGQGGGRVDSTEGVVLSRRATTEVRVVTHGKLPTLMQNGAYLARWCIISLA